MLEDAATSRDTTFPSPASDPVSDARYALRVGNGFLVLVSLTFGLIVLGALVRANEAGLACPDWPLCFGEVIPQIDVRVGFEWTHRAVAGSISLIFGALAWLALRRPHTRRASARLVGIGALLLVVQIGLGALTVWQLLASWTVTSHLVTGNAYALVLLWTACALREAGGPPIDRAPAPARVRVWVTVAALLLFAQLVLGGLVSSRYAGMVCPEWPTCNGGYWFPSFEGNVGLHLLHRLNGYALLAVLLVSAGVGWRVAGMRAVTLLTFVLGSAQLLVGIANVLLAIPVEVTALHSALAVALVLTVSLTVRSVWRSATVPGNPVGAT